MSEAYSAASVSVTQKVCVIYVSEDAPYLLKALGDGHAVRPACGTAQLLGLVPLVSLGTGTEGRVRRPAIFL